MLFCSTKKIRRIIPFVIPLTSQVHSTGKTVMNTFVVAVVMVNISKRPRIYFTSHVKGRFKDWGKLY
jgi:hypothetical protein